MSAFQLMHTLMSIMHLKGIFITEVIDFWKSALQQVEILSSVQAQNNKK